MNRDYSPLMMTNYPHLHFGLLLCLPQTIASVLNSSLVLWHWQWCLEAISFCHAHTHTMVLLTVYILFAAKFMTCVFSSNANAKLHSFSTFYCHFFLPQERSAISLTTCNWLQAIHFLELFLSFRNGHFLRSNLISSCCVFVEI